MPADTAFMEKLTALCKRRGFIFPSSEIYGGIGGFWDYGPMGVELKRNIKQAWWQDMVINPPNGPDGQQVTMVGLDCSIIMNPKVWEASGHVGGFSDPMVDCRTSKQRFRADQAWVVGFYSADDWRSLQESAQSARETGHGVDALVRSEWERDPRKAQEDLEEAKAGLSDLVARGHRSDVPTIPIAVEASVKDEAIAIAKSMLSRKQRQDLGTTERNLAYNQRDLPKTWPRLSPATQENTLTEPREFNLMFETFVGALQDSTSKAYLRPETAQGIFANYKNVLDTSRVKLPFGIAQIGKAFRNEINPRNYTFRSREFEQMEIEFFCKGKDELQPGEVSDLDWYQFWRNTRFDWYVHLGLKSEKLRLRDQTADELAHYSSACADIEYLFPFSDEFQELEGCAHRGCYDLSQHQKHSGRDLGYFDDELWQRDAATYKDDKNAAKEAKSKPPYKFIPTVIEPSAGADRATLAFLCEAYTEDQAPTDKGQMETRVVMKFHPRLAPIKAAFLPLINKLGLPELAQKMCRAAKQRFNAFYDDGGAIGRRYRRQDEAGTPFCVTFDGETVEDGNPNKDTVTIRDRDTLKQQRVHVDRVLDWLQERLA